MSVAAKFFVVCVSGCGLIPFFIDTNPVSSLINSSSLPNSIPLDAPEEEEPEVKNCQVIEKLSENVFWDLIVDEEDYITISCKDTNVDINEIMPHNWKGLFPKVLFKSHEFHKTGFEFELKTKTERLGEEESYNTVFYGSSLENSSIIGEWNSQTKPSDGKSYLTIHVLGRLGKANSIYILSQEKKST